MIHFYDHRSTPGGGQLALWSLVRELERREVAVTLRVPPALHQSLRQATGWSPASHRPPALRCRHLRDGARQVFIANSYGAILPALGSAALARRGVDAVVTGAIMHSYPQGRLRESVFHHLLDKCDVRIPVEPGLASVHSDVLDVGVLTLDPAALPTAGQSPGVPRRSVKCFGRPDPVKGLDLLPKIFRDLSSDDPLVRPRVALGNPLHADHRYVAALRKELAPWLEASPRDRTWIQFGDIFVFPSRSETAAITAQEAMSRGAYLVAADVGCLRSLAHPGLGVDLFPVGGAGAATLVSRARNMSEDEFTARCRSNMAHMRKMAGDWYRRVVALLLELDGAS